LGKLRNEEGERCEDMEEESKDQNEKSEREKRKLRRRTLKMCTTSGPNKKPGLVGLCGAA
jgi:hypothetical protein